MRKVDRKYKYTENERSKLQAYTSGSLPSMEVEKRQYPIQLSKPMTSIRRERQCCGEACASGGCRLVTAAVADLREGAGVKRNIGLPLCTLLSLTCTSFFAHSRWAGGDGITQTKNIYN